VRGASSHHRAHSAFQRGKGSTERITKLCILAFPSIWYYRREDRDDRFDWWQQQWWEWFWDDRFQQDRSEANALFSKLTSFLTKPPFLRSSGDDTHHKLIAIILILEHACLSYASSSKLTSDEALDQAYSRYHDSKIHNEVTMQFSKSAEVYSTIQFTGFITTHRL